MQRRKFIRNTAAAAIAIPAINGLSMKAYGEGSYLDEFYTSTMQTDHILVVIQMSGGNDGLNMVIPLDQYGAYQAARTPPTGTPIALQQNKILVLPGTNGATGFHPALAGSTGTGGLWDLFNQGYVNVIQSASYPTPNYSHFRATDIYMTAANQDEYLIDGWLGRYMNTEYPGYPNGYPSPANPHPLGIQYGSGTSLVTLGPTSQMSITISDPTKVVTDGGISGDPAPATPAGEKLAYVRSISAQSDAFSTAIKNAYNSTSNIGTYPTGNTLADQLKTTARLIRGGLGTKIYCCNIGGFDLHANATVSTDSTATTGAHATLLMRLGEAIKAFHADLTAMGKADRVIGMTFSEFGRRIKSNASGGTDHGAAFPMFVFGNKVTGGVTNPNPIIPVGSALTVNSQIAMQTDFRSVYSSILKRWLCQDDSSTLSIMLRNYPQMNICNDADCIPHATEPNIEYSLITNYPNPATSYTMVEFKTDGGHTLMQLVGPNGRMISTIMEKTFNGPQTGTQRVDLSNQQMGMYYIRFQNGNKTQMKSVLKVR